MTRSDLLFMPTMYCPVNGPVIGPLFVTSLFCLTFFAPLWGLMYFFLWIVYSCASLQCLRHSCWVFHSTEWKLRPEDTSGWWKLPSWCSLAFPWWMHFLVGYFWQLGSWLWLLDPVPCTYRLSLGVHPPVVGSTSYRRIMTMSLYFLMQLLLVFYPWSSTVYHMNQSPQQCTVKNISEI